MQNEIEDEVRKNLIIHLSHHGCKFCYKPYSNATIVELDELTFIFAEKLFYKFDCSVVDNNNTVKKHYRKFTENLLRCSFSILKPSLPGNILRFGITCIYCWDTKYIEYNLSKFNGTKNYL
jgi:hypothetical protein